MSRWWGKKKESNERQKGNRTSWDEKRHRKDNSWSVNVVVSFPSLPGEVTVYFYYPFLSSSNIFCWTFFSCFPVSVHLSSSLSLSLLSVYSFVSLSTSLSIFFFFFFFILVLYSHTSISALLFLSYCTLCLLLQQILVSTPSVTLEPNVVPEDAFVQVTVQQTWFNPCVSLCRLLLHLHPLIHPYDDCLTNRLQLSVRWGHLSVKTDLTSMLTLSFTETALKIPIRVK